MAASKAGKGGKVPMAGPVGGGKAPVAGPRTVTAGKGAKGATGKATPAKGTGTTRKGR